jgi:hypothetical protein
MLVPIYESAYLGGESVWTYFALPLFFRAGTVNMPIRNSLETGQPDRFRGLGRTYNPAIPNNPDIINFRRPTYYQLAWSGFAGREHSQE